MLYPRISLSFLYKLKDVDPNKVYKKSQITIKMLT